ncbi:MAG: hypothetical protein QM764_12680 [Chitinophagaceae bacterium]
MISAVLFNALSLTLNNAGENAICFDKKWKLLLGISLQTGYRFLAVPAMQDFIFPAKPGLISGHSFL